MVATVSASATAGRTRSRSPTSLSARTGRRNKRAGQCCPAPASPPARRLPRRRVMPPQGPQPQQARDQAGKAVGVGGKTVDTTQEHASGGDAPPPQQSKSARAVMRKKWWCGCWRNSARRRRDLPRASASEARPTSLAGSSPARSGDKAAPFIATAAAQESARRHAPYPRPRGQSSKTGTTGRVYPAYRVPRR
jgi:hypothetical protein